MESTLRDLSDLRIVLSSKHLFHGVVSAALLTLATSIAGAGSPEPEVLQQRLGVSRVSVQSLHLGAPAPTISLDLDGRRLTLRLEPSTLRAAGYRVLVQGADGALRQVPAPAAATYRGTVLEIPGSVVGGTIRNGSLRAAIALGDGRVFFVQPLSGIAPGSAPDQHAIYDAADVTEAEGTCAASEPPAIVTPDLGSGDTSAGGGMRTAELAIDADFEFFTANGSSVDGTLADIDDVIAGVNAIYERDVTITHAITTVIVRSAEPDPYDSTGASGLLTQFRNHWNSTQGGVQRDVVHLMTGKNLDGSTIGIASVGAVCNLSRAYGLSQSRFSSTLSRRCALTAHELGHNWNAQHCDAVTPCNIMCSSINGCDGLGLPNFEPQAIAAIESFAAGRTCLSTPQVAVGEPDAGGLVRFAAPSPSPFTEETILSFQLLQEARVELDIYDVAGHRVSRLAEGMRAAGGHRVTWGGRDDAGRQVSAGVYYARLKAAGAMVTQRVVLLR